MIHKWNRILSKKVNIRANVMTIIFSFIVLLLVYSIIAKECHRGNNETLSVRKPKYRLILIVLSSPDNMKSRVAVRKTWMSASTDNIKHFFAIGTLDSQQEQYETLLSEQSKYNDLLLLPKLRDSYGTLTKKVLQSLVRMHDEYDFDYLLKCDDDSFVLLHQILVNLDSWERQGTRRELYWGFFNGKAHIKRAGPWREPEWNLCDYYLPYAVGGGYVLSYNLVQFIAVNADILRLYNSEDVSVGLWLAPVANIERKHDVRFDTEYRSRGCSNQYIITHKQSSEGLKALHDFYSLTGMLCAREEKSRMSYQYNWTVPPSQCCNRRADII